MKILTESKIKTFNLLIESFINNDLYSEIKDAPESDKIIMINKYIADKGEHITTDELGDLIGAFLEDNPNKGTYEDITQFIEKVISYKGKKLSVKEIQYLLMKTPYEDRLRLIDLITKLKNNILSQPEQNVLDYYKK
jgi:hypothetical protein